MVRPKDIRRIADRQERRREITRARAANQNMQDYLSGLYSHGEVVISHPEGMRIQGEMGLLQKEIIEHVVKVEQQLGMEISARVAATWWAVMHLGVEVIRAWAAAVRRVASCGKVMEISARAAAERWAVAKRVVEEISAWEAEGWPLEMHVMVWGTRVRAAADTLVEAHEVGRTISAGAAAVLAVE